MIQSSPIFHPFYTDADREAAKHLPHLAFLSPDLAPISSDSVTRTTVYHPDEGFHFLHEATIAEYHGVLFAAWYNNPEKELSGYTPICFKRSFDGGKTWSEPRIIAHDRSGALLYCPPILTEQEGRLYLLLNTMVGPDLIHSLDLYVWDEATDAFSFRFSRPIPFKLNTAPLTLDDGTLIFPGRVGALDKFPNTPAVLLAKNGIEGEYEVVPVAENGDLWNGLKLVHPEATLLRQDDTLYLFCRNDESHIPLVYLSRDWGQSWSAPFGHDIPYVSSKIYAGTLPDGRHYLIANTDALNRSRLTLYLSSPGSLPFDRSLILFDDPSATEWGACHYPAAYCDERVLTVIATVGYPGYRRGADCFRIDLNRI